MKKLIAIIIIIALGFIIRNIALSISSLTDNNRELTELKNNLITAKRENQLLKERIKFVKSDVYVEEEARNKLGLARENEYIVIEPQQKQKASIKGVSIQNEANWKKWLELFM